MNPSVIKDTDVLIRALRELGLSYSETVDLLNNTLNESRNAKKLWRIDGDKSASPLIRLGATLFIVPVPVVSEALGLILMSAGLFQTKVQGPPLKIDDIYETYEKISRELSEFLR